LIGLSSGPDDCRKRTAQYRKLERIGALAGGSLNQGHHPLSSGNPAAPRHRVRRGGRLAVIARSQSPAARDFGFASLNGFCTTTRHVSTQISEADLDHPLTIRMGHSRDFTTLRSKRNQKGPR
jgi:hypothetical protein